MGSEVLMVIGFLLLLIAGAMGLVWLERGRAYRVHVLCPPQKDYNYVFDNSTCVEQAVAISEEGFMMPALPAGCQTVVLEFAVQATLVGTFLDPVLEIGSESKVHRAFIERGARGKRHFDLSPFAAAEGWLPLRGRSMRWHSQRGVLRAWTNPIRDSDRILIVAPHPDDGEIAASSLYSHPEVHIVTITAGGQWHPKLRRLFPNGYDWNLGTRVRAWDSLAVPWLAGLPPRRCLQLAYPDGELAGMQADADREWQVEGNDFKGLRQINEFAGLRLSARCCWNSLVDDLEDILRVLRPTVIVLPCPHLDGHPDHKAVVRAVNEAVRRAKLPDMKFLLYVNHASEAELWPYGPAESDMTLPPVTASQYPVYGVCSRALSLQARNIKLLLLEAMHDLRDLPPRDAKLWSMKLKDLKSEIAAEVRGLDKLPNNYFRRAIRNNELFFVASHGQLQKLLGLDAEAGAS